MSQRGYFLLLAALAVAALSGPAGAGEDRPPPITEIVVDGDQLGRTGNVSIQQYDDSLWVRSKIEGEGVESDEEAREWELILHRDATCSDQTPHSTNHLAHFHYSWSNTYGTRVLTRYYPTFSLDEIGSVEIVHDGPNFEGHADHPGRHHLACAAV